MNWFTAGELPVTVADDLWMVLGAGRSGSTFLDLRLGQAGVAAVGEVCHVPERAGVRNELCGCGDKAHDCPYWSAVLADAFGPGWAVVCAELSQRLDRAVRPGRLPARVMASRRGRILPEDEATVVELGRLYRAMTRHAPGRTIWDSSKSPSYGALVAQAVPGVRFVGLTRDPRGVVDSWMHPKTRPEAEGGLMPTRSLGGATARWWYGVVGGWLVGTERQLCYHDLGPVGPVDLEATCGVGPWRHAIGGNPIRFEEVDRAAPDFVEDDRWRTRMRRRDRLLVGAVCGPLWWWCRHRGGAGHDHPRPTR